MHLHLQCVAGICRHSALPGFDNVGHRLSLATRPQLLLLLLLLRMNVIASLDFKVAATAKSCGKVKVSHAAVQCLQVAISLCRHRSVPVLCGNGSVETTVAEGGRNLVASLWC